MQPVSLADGAPAASAAATTAIVDESTSSSPAVLNETSPQGTAAAANSAAAAGGGVTGSTSLEVLKMKLENVMPSSSGVATTANAGDAVAAVSDGSQHSEQSTIHPIQSGEAKTADDGSAENKKKEKSISGSLSRFR